MRHAEGLLIVALAAVALPLRAQQGPPASLADALRRADTGAYANRMAAGERDARAAAATQALRGILPTLRFQGGYMGTNEPLSAFGTRLQQGAVAQADFDPARLNDPRAIGNVSTAAIVEAPLLVPEALAGRRAAIRAGEASAAGAEWTRAQTRMQVVRAWYGAVLARELVGALDTAAQAAHAHVRDAESAVRHGVATRSDALLAAVKAGEVDAQLAQARADAENARAGLAVALGAPGERGIGLPAHLPDTAAVRAFAVRDISAGERQDVHAAALGQQAAEADLGRARALLLPRLVSFARYDFNSPGRPLGGQGSWTAGVMLSWSPFSGASEIGERQAARGRLESAQAGADAARAQAALEQETATRAVETSLLRLAIAEDAVRQSAEAHRIVTRKYEGGLATVVELLDAAAVETQARVGLARAVHDAVLATAARLLASGGDPGAVAALEN
jgi:outer membrane protein TolC